VNQPRLSYLDFIKVAPMYIFNVSRQSENLKKTAVDATLFMTFAAAPAAIPVSRILILLRLA